MWESCSRLQTISALFHAFLSQCPVSAASLCHSSIPNNLSESTKMIHYGFSSHFLWFLLSWTCLSVCLTAACHLSLPSAYHSLTHSLSLGRFLHQETHGETENHMVPAMLCVQWEWSKLPLERKKGQNQVCLFVFPYWGKHVGSCQHRL